MTTTFEPLFFDQFTRDKASAFRRIASRTRGSHQADELKSEAWLIAIALGKRAGQSINLGDEAEQEKVLARLYKRFVEFVGGKLKESIDQETNEERSWHERLAAPQEVEPLTQLLRHAEESAAAPRKGFSQYSAYVILLERCEGSFTAVASYLGVSFATLKKRIELLSEHADIQPSLFDGIEEVDPYFEPRAAWLKRLWDDWAQRSRRILQAILQR